MCNGEYVVMFWMHASYFLNMYTTQDCLCDSWACFSPCGSHKEDSEDFEHVLEQQGGEVDMYFLLMILKE